MFSTLLVVGCSTSSNEATLLVPDEFPSIQAAVDSAGPGDLVLIEPGVYLESVVVETADLVIRGLDRNKVIVDGELTRETGIAVFADGVAVENLTIRNFTDNGVFFTGDYDIDRVLTGYRASYVTAHNNGLYGIYAFNANYGLIEHSYGSGHPESAFYIGQCQPCDALIVDSIGERNTFGYTGTNAGGELFLAGNVFRDNRIGASPNSLDSEELAPQRGAVFVGNTFANNNSDFTMLTAESLARFPVGVGVWIHGGRDNLVARNRFVDNLNVAVLMSVSESDNTYVPSENDVIANEVTGSAFGEVQDQVNWQALLTQVAAEPRRYHEIDAPPRQPTMADPRSAPPEPASTLTRVDDFDPDAVELPKVRAAN